MSARAREIWGRGILRSPRKYKGVFAEGEKYKGRNIKVRKTEYKHWSGRLDSGRNQRLPGLSQRVAWSIPETFFG